MAQGNAVDQLAPSKLDPETQLMQDDVELDDLWLLIGGKRQQNIVSRIVTGEVERTVDGASTVTIDTHDPSDSRELQNSGLLTNKTDINVDGLFFRLAAVDRSGDVLTLTFEDREVAILREHRGFRKANRDTMTRAEFAHALVREQKEERIRFFSPEQKIIQPVAPDLTVSDSRRAAGFAPGADVTVKGVQATKAQLNNIATVLSVGEAMNCDNIILVASIETITVESSALNLKGGDRDSVGIFQQRNIPPWNRRNRRDVAQAAQTFFEQAKKLEKSYRERGFTNFTAAQIAQGVQISAFPDRYKQWAQEALHTVSSYLGQSDNLQGSGSNNSSLTGSNGGGTYEFTRGTIDQYGRLTSETTWDCLNRLAQEVDWRCFMVNGTVYFISEEYLFRSRPRLKIGSKEQGVDQIDFHYDRSKANSQVTVTCHIARWGAPPGSVVQIEDHGVIDGRWLVQDISRSLFDNIGTIQLIKPLPILPEPPPTTGQGTTDQQIIGPTSSQRQAIVKAAQKVLANKNQYTYRQYRPMANSIFDEFAKDHTDCSAFVTLCYKAGGVSDPNGFNYNGQGYTGTLWNRGKPVKESDAQPGDLVFYGLRGSPHSGVFTRHVALYIGAGKTIEFGSTHPNQGTVHEARDFIGIRSYLD